jgi:hypothetical protein
MHAGNLRGFVARGDALPLLEDTSQFVPTTDHSQRILRKAADARTKQEVDYLQAFLLQFRAFQELSPAGLADCLASVTFEKLKPNTGGPFSCFLLRIGGRLVT